jgi:hypothetical protein
MEEKIFKAARNQNAAGLTTAPISIAPAIALKPEWLRLPKSPALCPYSGLTRSKLNEMVLPCKANNFCPPVQSISLRKRGQTKAVRLIVYDSLMAHLRY